MNEWVHGWMGGWVDEQEQNWRHRTLEMEHPGSMPNINTQG